MSSSVQRYIEEFRDIEEHPVYLPGDKLSLRLRVAHEVNLGSVWGIFRRVEAVVVPKMRRGTKVRSSGEPHCITLEGKHYPLSRAKALRASEVHFEMEVSRERHLPGEYEL